MLEIDIDEFGRFVVVTDCGQAVAGPYDTLEEAKEAYPDADLVADGGMEADDA